MNDKVDPVQERIAADILIAAINAGLFNVGNEKDKETMANQIGSWYQNIRLSVIQLTAS